MLVKEPIIIASSFPGKPSSLRPVLLSVAGKAPVALAAS